MDIRNLLCLSIQRALLGEISPFLRAVVFSYISKEIEVRFYFDGVIKEEDLESVSYIETQVIADYDVVYTVSAICKRLDFPDPIIDQGIWVYYRRE